MYEHMFISSRECIFNKLIGLAYDTIKFNAYLRC